MMYFTVSAALLSPLNGKPILLNFDRVNQTGFAAATIAEFCTAVDSWHTLDYPIEPMPLDFAA